MFNGRSTTQTEEQIENNGFWPDISIDEFQRQRAIPLQIPQEMVTAALIAAMHGLAVDLAEVEQAYNQQGISCTEDIYASLINGENSVQALYKKAVFARAKADLLPEFNTLSGREIHQNREYVTEQKSLLAEATHAIRTLKGKKRGSVWLL